MSIKDLLNKIKPFSMPFIIALVCIDFAGLFYIILNQKPKEPVSIIYNKNSLKTTVFGSKTGKKYYFPWCGGLSRIKPENRVEFASASLALSSGYTPAKNCGGL